MHCIQNSNCPVCDIFVNVGVNVNMLGGVVNSHLRFTTTII